MTTPLSYPTADISLGLGCPCPARLLLLLLQQALGNGSLPVSSGLIEGFKVEQASLQEALGQKETAEQGLAIELESLRRQLERATQQQAELREENSVLWTQKEALAAEAGEREDGKKCWFRGWRWELQRVGAGATLTHQGPWKEGRGPDQGGWCSILRVAAPLERRLALVAPRVLTAV